MLHVSLTDAQRVDLEALRDRDPRPYLRERAAAILKVAQNQSAVQVARTGLLRSHHRSTVERWVRRFREQGSRSLVMDPRGGGRPPGAKDKAPRRRTPRIPCQDRPDP